ncbi:hypothetical protein ACTWP5_10500 [Streptomyces sp. 4N509B]|uniref:hypothetical protein n=1 Tax=Streptomyces sp. 4N509B TaxID=3457413 RepID=UPI003FD24CFD
MDPITLGQGVEPLPRRLSHYVVLTLASVLAPGVVLVVTAGALAVRARHGGRAWQVVVDTSDDVDGALTALLAVALLAAAYVVGYVARELAFAVLGFVERLGTGSLPSASALRRQLVETFGQAAVQDCLRAHPLLDHFLGSPQEPTPVRWRGGGSLRLDNGLEAFLYAKSWLGLTAPNDAPNDIETEINVLLSLLLPVGLGGWTVVAFAQPGPAVTALVAALTAGTWWLLLVSALRLRRAERWESLRGMVAGHAMGLAAAHQRGLTLAVPQPAPDPGALPAGGEPTVA